MEHLNSVDIYLGAIFVVSIIFGILRGMIREVFSLLTWIAAFSLASVFSGRIANAFSGALSSTVTGATGVNSAKPISMVAIGIVFVCIFVLTIIIGKFIGSMLSRAAEGSGISLGNRLFGGLFGFLRGFLIVLVVIFLAELTPLGRQVIWNQSQIIIAYRPVIKWLDDLIQPGLQGIKSTVGGAMDKVKQNYGGSGAGNLLNQ